MSNIVNSDLIKNIRNLLITSRNQVVQTVNSVMVQTYWNIGKMRQFYLTFPNQDAVSLKLTWSHYRTLIRIENPQAREWYIKESIVNNWSTRALERAIGLILCSEPSLAVAKYSILNESKQLFSSKYLPFLPTIEELENKRAVISDRVENE